MKNILAVSAAFLVGIGAIAGAPATVPKVHRDCTLSCHRPHRASNEQGTLLKKEGLNETCLKCHNSKDPTEFSGAAPQIRPSETDFSSHVSHRTEKGKAVYFRKYVFNNRNKFLSDTCSGCHDPHLTDGQVLKTMAFDDRGNPTSSRRRFVGELCYGCHAGVEAAGVGGFSDIGLLTGTTARSAHKLGADPASRKDLPSLRKNLRPGPLDCVSCHDSPDGKGPHYSRYPSLLMASFGKESSRNGSGIENSALCYSCHDRDSIEADQSFPLHNEHITGIFELLPKKAGDDLDRRREKIPSLPSRTALLDGKAAFRSFGQPTACATCHDPHGSVENPFLISFDRDVVRPNSFGRADFRRTGIRHGYCNLSCHGHDHIDSEY